MSWGKKIKVTQNHHKSQKYVKKHQGSPHNIVNMCCEVSYSILNDFGQNDKIGPKKLNVRKNVIRWSAKKLRKKAAQNCQISGHISGHL